LEYDAKLMLSEIYYARFYLMLKLSINVTFFTIMNKFKSDYKKQIHVCEVWIE